MGLDSIIKNNHYPIVFIGSGISKRYLEDSPDWNSLLEEYWNMLKTGTSYYTHLHELKKKYKDRDDCDFIIKALIATEIENKFNDKFYDEDITVPNLTLKDAFDKNISPFRVHLSQKFRNYKIKSNIDPEEFDLFRKVLQKSRIIVTTNYDTLIEDTITKNGNHHPKVYVGNAGFFDDSSMGWSEIYKIHGSVTKPSSIVITENDYKKYDQNSILVTAKILSSMVDSPILFLGYSMTDRNVLKMLNDFSTQLPEEDVNKSASRILIVEREKNQEELKENQMVSTNNQKKFSYTLIKTDNFKKLFSRLQKINEGVSPYEVRKFESVIKKIIVSKGQKQALDSYLVSPQDLDNLSAKIDSGKRIVVALGDTKNIFVTPSTVDYFKDYVSGKFEFLPENALKFIAHAQQNGRFPMLHHYHNVNLDETSLEEYEKKRIIEKVKNDETNLEKIKNTINIHNRIHFDTLNDILSSKLKTAKKIDCMTYNIKHLSFDDIDNYIRNVAINNFCESYIQRDTKQALERTAYRKLIVAWDILKYGKK